MGVKIRKKNGKWYVFVNYNGKRKAKCVGVSRELAETVRRTLEAKLALGDIGFLEQAESKPTLNEYSDRWFREHAEIQCKPSTVYSYRQLLRLYVKPRFGDMPLDTIKRDDVKAFITEYSSAGKLSRNTVRLMLSALRVILNHAIEDGIIDHNPAERLGRLTKTQKAKREATALTKAEAEKFLDAVRAICPEQYPLFLTALRAGLRRGELVALKWGDIQFGENEQDSNRFILVQRNYVHGKFTTPKSKKNRRVDLSRQLRQALIELRDVQLFEAFLQGRNSIADDLVFQSGAETIVDPDNLVSRSFLPALEKAGLRKIRFHDLRHTFGSLLIQDGASLTYVKEQMGHSSIQITVDTYGHLIPGADIAWVDRLDSKTTQQPNATQAQPEEEAYKEDVANELISWRALRDSNSRPTDSKSVALST